MLHLQGWEAFPDLGLSLTVLAGLGSKCYSCQAGCYHRPKCS